jgi:hypothetical protein
MMANLRRVLGDQLIIVFQGMMDDFQRQGLGWLSAELFLKMAQG